MARCQRRETPAATSWTDQARVCRGEEGRVRLWCRETKRGGFPEQAADGCEANRRLQGALGNKGQGRAQNEDARCHAEGLQARPHQALLKAGLLSRAVGRGKGVAPTHARKGVTDDPGRRQTLDPKSLQPLSRTVAVKGGLEKKHDTPY